MTREATQVTSDLLLSHLYWSCTRRTGIALYELTTHTRTTCARTKHTTYSRPPTRSRPPPQVTVTKDDTILLHGAGDKASIQGRCDQIKAAIEGTTSDYDRWGLAGDSVATSGGWGA